MAAPDPFSDLRYLNAPGFTGYGDDDADVPSGAMPAPTPAPAIAVDPVPSAQVSTEPTIPFPGADPPLPASVPGSAPTASRRAGAAIVLCGVGAGAGALVGGAWGAGSGLLFAGATMNAYRAKTLFGTGSPTDRSEAVKSTIMAVLGLGVASYLGYRAHQARDDDGDDD